MDQHDIILVVKLSRGAKAVINRLLAAGAAGNHFFDLLQIVLPDQFPHVVDPAFQHHDYNAVDLGVTFKSFERVDDNGLSVKLEELFRPCPRVHSLACSSSKDHNLTILKVLYSPGSHKELGKLRQRYGGHKYRRLIVLSTQSIGKGNTVHNGGQHSHRIGIDLIHVGCHASSPEIATSQNDPHLKTGFGQLSYLPGVT